MRLYIAAPWAHRDKAQAVALEFENNGHDITEKWWLHKDVGQGDMGKEPEEMASQAKADEIGVLNADHFIFLNLAYSEGKCVELGMALSEGTPILAIGEPAMNVFHYHPRVKWVETVEEALERIGRVKRIRTKAATAYTGLA